MASAYDDELWRLAGDHPGHAPAHLVRFVESLPRASRALDLGCGDGRLTASLRAEQLTGADVSRVALERAAQRLPGAELVELEPDAPLPLEDNSFDLVLCAETLEHVRDVGLLVSEARRVLKPRGQLALTTPARGRGTGLAILGRGIERELDPLSPHLRHFSRRSLGALLEGGGFEIASIERRSGSLLAVGVR